MGVFGTLFLPFYTFRLTPVSPLTQPFICIHNQSFWKIRTNANSMTKTELFLMTTMTMKQTRNRGNLGKIISTSFLGSSQLMTLIAFLENTKWAMRKKRMFWIITWNSKGKLDTDVIAGFMGLSIVVSKVRKLYQLKILIILSLKNVGLKHKTTCLIRNLKKMLEFVMLSEERDIERWVQPLLEERVQIFSFHRQYSYLIHFLWRWFF